MLVAQGEITEEISGDKIVSIPLEVVKYGYLQCSLKLPSELNEDGKNITLQVFQTHGTVDNPLYTLEPKTKDSYYSSEELLLPTGLHEINIKILDKDTKSTVWGTRKMVAIKDGELSKWYFAPLSTEEVQTAASHRLLDEGDMKNETYLKINGFKATIKKSGRYNFKYIPFVHRPEEESEGAGIYVYNMESRQSEEILQLLSLDISHIYCDYEAMVFTYSTYLDNFNESSPNGFVIFKRNDLNNPTTFFSNDLTLPSPDGREELYVADIDFTNKTLIDSAPDIREIKWSLSGDYLYYLKGDIVVIKNMETSQKHVIDLEVNEISSIELSPNNSYLLVGYDDNSYSIKVFETSTRTQILHDDYTHYYTRRFHRYNWSLDSTSFWNSNRTYLHEIKNIGDEERAEGISLEHKITGLIYDLTVVNEDSIFLMRASLDSSIVRVSVYNPKTLTQLDVLDLPGKIYMSYPE